MATTTANMSLLKPTNAGDTGAWGTYLNTGIDLIDLHDHSSGKGVRVPTSGLNINADLTFAGNAATNLEACSFAGVSTYTTNKSLWVDSDDNELYWRSNAGTNVKVTSGASLNLSLVGGITGDYASASASFYYDDANKTYRALRTAPLPNFWASVSAGDVDLYEKASGITTRVRLSSPAALAASYALTFPAALPASTLLVQCSAAGVITFSNTVSVDIKHGDKVLNIPAVLGTFDANWGPEAGGLTMASSGAGFLFVPIPLLQGDRIKSVTFARRGDAAVDLTDITVSLITAAASTTAIGNTSITNVANSWNDTTIDVTDSTLAAGETVTIYFQANAVGARIGNIRVTYDRP